MKSLFIYLLLGTLACNAFSKEIKLLKAIPASALYMTTDDIGNVYLLTKENNIIRYNEFGDSTGFYKSVLNGKVNLIDATNPLRSVVYYQQYLKVILLDRMMTIKNELNLRKIPIVNAPVVAASADGTLWVYDQFNAKLLKIDEQLKIINSSNDLRQELQTVPNPSFMIERNWKVYVCDTAQGIFIFDRYGNFTQHIFLKGIEQLQVADAKLIYRKNNQLLSWDMSKIKEEKMDLPNPENTILQAMLVRKKLYVLYKDSLKIYQL